MSKKSSLEELVLRFSTESARDVKIEAYNGFEYRLKLLKLARAELSRYHRLETAARCLLDELEDNWVIENLLDAKLYEDTGLSGRAMKGLAAVLKETESE